jgi:hypothetical protein
MREGETTGDDPIRCLREASELTDPATIAPTLLTLIEESRPNQLRNERLRSWFYAAASSFPREARRASYDVSPSPNEERGMACGFLFSLLEPPRPLAPARLSEHWYDAERELLKSVLSRDGRAAWLLSPEARNDVELMSRAVEAWPLALSVCGEALRSNSEICGTAVERCFPTVRFVALPLRSSARWIADKLKLSATYSRGRLSKFMARTLADGGLDVEDFLGRQPRTRTLREITEHLDWGDSRTGGDLAWSLGVPRLVLSWLTPEESWRTATTSELWAVFSDIVCCGANSQDRVSEEASQLWNDLVSKLTSAGRTVEEIHCRQAFAFVGPQILSSVPTEKVAKIAETVLRDSLEMGARRALRALRDAGVSRRCSCRRVLQAGGLLSSVLLARPQMTLWTWANLAEAEVWRGADVASVVVFLETTGILENFPVAQRDELLLRLVLALPPSSAEQARRLFQALESRELDERLCEARAQLAPFLPRRPSLNREASQSSDPSREWKLCGRVGNFAALSTLNASTQPGLDEVLRLCEPWRRYFNWTSGHPMETNELLDFDVWACELLDGFWSWRLSECQKQIGGDTIVAEQARVDRRVAHALSVLDPMRPVLNVSCLRAPSQLDEEALTRLARLGPNIVEIDGLVSAAAALNITSPPSSSYVTLWRQLSSIYGTRAVELSVRLSAQDVKTDIWEFCGSSRPCTHADTSAPDKNISSSPSSDEWRDRAMRSALTLGEYRQLARPRTRLRLLHILRSAYPSLARNAEGGYSVSQRDFIVWTCPFPETAPWIVVGGCRSEERGREHSYAALHVESSPGCWTVLNRGDGSMWSERNNPDHDADDTDGETLAWQNLPDNFLVGARRGPVLLCSTDTIVNGEVETRLYNRELLDSLSKS